MDTQEHSTCNHSEDSLLNVFNIARQEAERLKHGYIGTEHILLALCAASNVLERLGVDAKEIRYKTEEALTAGTCSLMTATLPFTPSAKKVLEIAVNEADFAHSESVTCEHLLGALLQDGDGIPAKVLSDAGISLDKVRKLPGHL